jgi:hypothetical protein
MKRVREVSRMGDLDEALQYHYHLVDSWSVRFQHISMIVSSLLIFSLYGVFLWLLFSLSPNILTSFLLLGTQIGLGIPMTRAYYDFGISTRNLLNFYDPGLHDVDEDVLDIRINSGDIPLLFERMGLQVQKYDKTNFDDLTDFSWFLIITWTIISTGAHFASLFGQSLYIFGVMILLVACTMCYTSGYWTNRGFSFEEDLDHLEYYIDTIVKILDAVLPGINGTLIFQLKRGRRDYAIVDIAAEFIFLDTTTLEYHFGLSSNLQERFIIDASDDIIVPLYEKLSDMQYIQDSGWELEQVNTKSGYVIRIVNPHTTLNIAKRSTFVIGPSIVEQKAGVPREILIAIASAIG